MMVVIEGLLDAQRCAALRRELATARWLDGSATAGALASAGKCNRQAASDCPVAEPLGVQLLNALERHPTFVSAALPRRLLPLRFNAYGPGDHYAAHVDAALLRQEDGTLLRADIAGTLFLSDPASYSGGELEIETAFGAQQVKLAAGDLVLYPASSLHRVCAVTEGERIAAILWLESLVSDAGRRELLYELDQSIQSLRGASDVDEPTVLRLSGVYHNLLRRWARP